MARYFPATAMGGRLFIQGVTEYGTWNESRLVYWDSEAVNRTFHPLAGDRKVDAAVDLKAVVEESERGLPAIKVWIHEGLKK